ncbi:MAG: DegV family protein [Oscillospiraceae bacterium]|nr:DegV family protein [Oscillospiraceae bacterium]
MRKPVLVSCDSACDISPELREQYGVEVTPMYIHEGDKTFRDGVDITPEDIYRIYEETGLLPQTSAISPDEYYQFFKRFTDQGFAVIHIALSSGISSTCQNAGLAASELEDVYVLNSLALSCSGGLLAAQACRMRDEGMDASKIAEEIERRIPRTSTSFIVGTLAYLAKGGRCSSVTALGANLLGIKPSVEMSGGTLSVAKKYRGKTGDCFVKFLRDKLALAAEESDGGSCCVYHAGIPADLFEQLVEITKESGIFQEVITARAGSIISSHCGPETIGFTYQKKA